MSSFTPTRQQQQSYNTRPPAYLTEKYEFGQRLGGGAFGDVWLAHLRIDGNNSNTTTSTLSGRKMVAIKHIKRQYNRWEDCLKLRECRALSKLPAHRNCVKLFQLIHEKNELFFVFEYCPMDLHQLTMARRNERKPFTNREVLKLTYELLSALQHLHRHGFFHRDIKPENLLVTEATNGNTIGTVKLADFGQTREIRSRPPFTDYVATRWYRAPEILDGSGKYNSPVDIWAAGCVLGELITCGQPIFPGQSVLQQIDMVQKARHPEMVDVDKWSPQNVQDVSSSPETINLLRSMLSYDQRKRPNAKTTMRAKIFDECRKNEEMEIQKQQQQQKQQKQQQQKHQQQQQQQQQQPKQQQQTTALTAPTMAAPTNKKTGKENTLTTPTKSKRVSQLLKEAGFASPPDSGTSNGSRMMKSSSEHILRQAFSKYDQQNTGFIDAEAVSKILVKLGDFEKGDDSEEASMSLMAAEAEVALADTSARGVLSYEDFKEWFSERTSGTSTPPNCTPGTSARVAAARQLLVKSWDSPTVRHKSITPAMEVSNDQNKGDGSATGNTSKLRPRPPPVQALKSTSPKKASRVKSAAPSPLELKMVVTTNTTNTANTDNTTTAAPATTTTTTKETYAPQEKVAVLSTSPNRSLFNRFDSEQTGYLDKKRFGKMMEHMGMVTNPDNEDDILVEAEMAMIADEEGKVKYNDWIEWYKDQ
jgi:protein kinase